MNKTLARQFVYQVKAVLAIVVLFILLIGTSI